ncbi:MAG: pilus assembly FimT family protein [Akkermansiaceae bacterium]
MQLVHKHIKSQKVSGFTLLELVFVLSMIAVLVTWVTVSIATVESEQKLREAAGSIELLAKRGLSVAITQQRPYELSITANMVSLAPKYVLNSEGDSWGRQDERDDDEASRSLNDVIANEPMATGVSYEIKRWRSNEWLVMEKDKKVVIGLSPQGLIEPISIRCSVGNSWIMHELHPLTADIRDEEMSIEKE